jgi:hypothetical protein
MAALQDAGRRQRVVLGGELVIVSLDPTLNPGHGFTRQRPRRACHWLALRQTTQLHVWVHPDVLARPGPKVELLADHYLRHILSRTAAGIYIGAMPAGETTSALALVYDGRCIVKVADYHNLPPMQVPKRLAADLAAIAADLTREHPGLPVTTLAPLGQDCAVGQRHVPEQVLFRRARPARLNSSVERASGAWVLVAALAACGPAYYTYVYVHDRHALVQARAEFAQLFRGLPEQARQTPLPLLEARRAFLTAPNRQLEAATGVELMLRQMGQEPGLRVESLTRYFSAHGNKDQPEADFLATVVVAADTNVPVLTQGKELLGRLAASTGYELTLSPQGWSERSEIVRGRPRTVRVYTIYGAHSAKKATGR